MYCLFSVVINIFFSFSGSVLESILSPEACKNGLPTVAGLLTHPFFNQVKCIGIRIVLDKR